MPNKLYLRIWLAVVLAVAVLTLLVGWAWRLATVPPWRELELRDESGQVIARSHPHMRPGQPMPPGALPPEARPNAAPNTTANSREAAPDVTMHRPDGSRMRLHMVRPPPSLWGRAPFGFGWMLLWVGLAVALATYPIVRTLTRRLERLQAGVQQWGEGDLGVRVNEHGQDEVAFLARSFNQAAQRIQSLVDSHTRLLASQRSLLANASHELRSPLTRIRMGLELLGPQASADARAEIARNIAELDQLIDEILLASRLEAQQADLGTPESVDLLALAAEECARVEAELSLADPDTAGRLTVQGEPKLLRRALRNLLENARRHAASAPQVALARVGQQVEVRVCDQGPGVPEALRERIFEPFYRLPGATERDGGVGLGLALVRSIAQRHGGHVHCEANPGGGACFVLTVPADPESDA
ncbi:MAG: hypothetical protein Fur007_05350 [Rhodoferax sp.]